MESEAIWDNTLTNISWIVSGHPDFMFRDSIKETIVQGIANLQKTPEQEARLAKIEKDVGFEYAPSMVVRQRTITHRHEGTEVQTNALMISARNPYKKILEDLIVMLDKNILGEGIRIIPCNFDYEKSGSEDYARLLITNNEFQNSHTGLEIHNIVARMLDVVGQNNNITSS